MTYAAYTKVAVSQTQSEIRTLVKKAGAADFGFMGKHDIPLLPGP